MRSANVWAAATLRHQRMPLQEIRAILSADDPAIVRRHLELHRERLEERIAEQRALLASLERALSGDLPPKRSTGADSCPAGDRAGRRTRTSPGP
jgi:DNA-binding transcriptional MerR regulator